MVQGVEGIIVRNSCCKLEKQMIEAVGALSDTDPATEEFYYQRLRTMSPGEKLRRMSKLSVFARRFVVAEVYAKYPHATAEEFRKRIVARLYGRETSISYFSWDPDKEGY